MSAEPYPGPGQVPGLGSASVAERAGAGVAPGPVAHSTARGRSLGTPAHGKRAADPDQARADPCEAQQTSSGPRRPMSTGGLGKP